MPTLPVPYFASNAQSTIGIDVAFKASQVYQQGDSLFVKQFTPHSSLEWVYVMVPSSER